MVSEIDMLLIFSTLKEFNFSEIGSKANIVPVMEAIKINIAE